jgi:2,4-dienoyl-CoA reductase-like NADH-dependent reductase (Old Yellow Enzyme family)
MDGLLATKLRFKSGHEMNNRFMLAPMTNCQSHADGMLSDAEFKWLVMRAKGGFSLTMTCAAHVQRNGQGFAGQLGVFSDAQIPGHRRLATDIKAHGALALIQLHHAGMRAPRELIGGQPVCPSDDPETNARALSIDEVKVLRESFIEAAVRAQASGYDGVQVHGAHGYVLAQFLSAKYNRRSDQYGGTKDNRLRLILEIVEGIRKSCGTHFLIGLRLSPERFGMNLVDCIWFCNRMIEHGHIDFLDISLWDAFKMPIEENFQHQPLLNYFTALSRGDVRLTVAGKISGARDVNRLLAAGVDFVGVGRAGILHHDFPRLAMSNPQFTAAKLPASVQHLLEEGLSEVFINYLRKWPDFVEEV